MSQQSQKRRPAAWQGIKKVVVSIFVVFTFAAYAVHEHLTDQEVELSAATSTAYTAQPVPPTFRPAASATTHSVVSVTATALPTRPSPTPVASTAQPSSSATAFATAPQPTSAAPATATSPKATSLPTQARPTPTTTPVVAAANSPYKDGVYTGPAVNAYWGMVQVQAVVENGKIANVECLKYPSDRRTSVRINTTAVPLLQREVIQAQSAHVNIISGATLTSKAYMESLQTALDSAGS